MEKIAYIVPSESMIPVIEKYLQEDVATGKVVVQTIDVFHPLSEYRRLCAEEYGAIIARGGTYNDLKKVADSANVIEERIRTSDVLNKLSEVRENYEGRVYVILRNDMARKFEKTIGLFNFPITVKRYDSLDSLKEEIDSIEESNVAVLCSGIAAMITNRSDLQLIELTNRDTTVNETVKIAKNYLEQYQESTKRVNVLESIFDNVDEGVLIFDKDNVVKEMNRKASMLLQKSMDEIIGFPIDNAVPDMPKKRDGNDCVDTPRTFVRKIGEAMLNFTLHPFKFYKEEERYIATVEDVTKIQALERNIRMKLAQKGLVARYNFDDIITKDDSMKNLIAKAKTIAGFEGSVLIYGENGTGKELFSQSIHNGSRRKDGPFVAVNCAALTESLLESELFGYVAGAFTGARKEGKAGLFELAHNGTIFLDEINSMSLSLQAKILRVIEQQEVMRVGSDYIIPLNVRIIAASNSNLEEYIKEDKFRRDLFFRLNTFKIDIPSMKERKDDIVILFKHYLSQLENVKPEKISLEKDFEDALKDHEWLGNVREIRSTALRYHAFEGDNSAGNILSNEKEPSSLVGDDLRIDLSELSKTVEGLVIESLLAKGMSKKDVAMSLGISRQALYKKINK